MATNAYGEFASTKFQERANNNMAGTVEGGHSLEGWGSVTPKPNSTESMAMLDRSSHSNHVAVRAAGGVGTRQWSPAVPVNGNPIGLITKETSSLHTAGSGVVVSVVQKNSQAAWARTRWRMGQW